MIHPKDAKPGDRIHFRSREGIATWMRTDLLDMWVETRTGECMLHWKFLQTLIDNNIRHEWDIAKA